MNCRVSDTLDFNSGKDDVTPPNMGKDLVDGFKGEKIALLHFMTAVTWKVSESTLMNIKKVVIRQK